MAKTKKHRHATTSVSRRPVRSRQNKQTPSATPRNPSTSTTTKKQRRNEKIKGKTRDHAVPETPAMLSLAHYKPCLPSPSPTRSRFKLRNKQYHYQVRHRSESIGDDTVPTPVFLDRSPALLLTSLAPIFLLIPHRQPLKASKTTTLFNSGSTHHLQTTVVRVLPISTR